VLGKLLQVQDCLPIFIETHEQYNRGIPAAYGLLVRSAVFWSGLPDFIGYNIPKEEYIYQRTNIPFEGPL
jgi:hypothetical protein